MAVDHLRRNKTMNQKRYASMSRWSAGLETGLAVLLIVGADIAAAMEPLSISNVSLVGHIDVEGGGMVDVKGEIAAVGHMAAPYATTILDVSNPSHPRVLSRIKVRPGTHSHKARICGSTLVINVEPYSVGGDATAGMALYDISDPGDPKEISFYAMGGLATGGTGMHRFQADCEKELIYASGSAVGFQGNISLIIDMSDPARPREVGRWWLPGQHVAAGEKPEWWGRSTRTHHPLRLGNRLYVSLWYGGFAVLDISSPELPELVSHVNYHDVETEPTHTALPVGHRIGGRDWLIVFDEAMGGGDSEAVVRFFDISDEKNPLQVSTFQVTRNPSGDSGCRFGPHQPHEFVSSDNLLYAAWFAGGLRIIDVSDPYSPAEAGYYVPRPAAGQECVQSNDVFVEESGIVYLIDRIRGLHILRYEGRPAR